MSAQTEPHDSPERQPERSTRGLGSSHSGSLGNTPRIFAMTVPLHRSKADLRKRVRAQINALSPQQREAASRQICSWLRGEKIWQAAGAILCFAPLADEPDIWPLVEECIAAGKTVGLPRFATGISGYVASRVSDLVQDIQIGKFGIREPAVTCPELELSRFDLILVPGVAFDRSGRRLGRGQGYYDRWLKGTQGARLCGVAFEEQCLGEIPAAEHDVTMHLVATATEIFHCRD